MADLYLARYRCFLVLLAEVSRWRPPREGPPLFLCPSQGYLAGPADADITTPGRVMLHAGER